MQCSKKECEDIENKVMNNKLTFDELDEQLEKCNKCYETYKGITNKNTRSTVGLIYAIEYNKRVR